MTSGLVEEQDAGYAFVHALARESAVRRAQRRPPDAAARPGRTDHRGTRDRTTPTRAPTIAHHAHLAAPLGPEHAARACRWLARAAAVADVAARPRRGARAVAAGRGRRPGRVRSPRSRPSAARRPRCSGWRAPSRPAPRSRRRSASGTQLGRWDLVAHAAAIYNGAGVWSWREHGVQDDAFIAVLTEATQHVSDPERARLLAALQMEHFYGWDSAVADPIGAESVEVARRLRRPRPAGRGADGAHPRHLGTAARTAAPGADRRGALLRARPGSCGCSSCSSSRPRSTRCFEPERADEAMQQCAERGRGAAPHRRGDPAGLVVVRPGARPGGPGRRRSSAERRSSCTARAATSRASSSSAWSRSGGPEPARRSPTEVVELAPRGQPRPAGDGRPRGPRGR